MEKNMQSKQKLNWSTNPVLNYCNPKFCQKVSVSKSYLPGLGNAFWCITKNTLCYAMRKRCVSFERNWNVDLLRERKNMQIYTSHYILITEFCINREAAWPCGEGTRLAIWKSRIKSRTKLLAAWAAFRGIQSWSTKILLYDWFYYAKLLNTLNFISH